MRKAILVGLFIFVTFGSNAKVNAGSLNDQAVITNPFHYSVIPVKTNSESKPEKKKEAPKPPKEKPVEPPETYTISSGDTLAAIADAHQTDWKRIFYKNTQISDPNTITSGEVITIPKADEQLAERPIVTLEAITPVRAQSNSAYTVARGSSDGNTYTPGYCTWYAKNRRPDLPNNLGNAGTWVSRAAAQGFATGSTPQAGAIGQQGGHVVYVESVNDDGTVTVSDMNYAGLFVVTTRTVSASNFMYIY